MGGGTLRNKLAGTGDLREGLLAKHPPTPPSHGVEGGSFYREGTQFGPGAECPHTASPTF